MFKIVKGFIISNNKNNDSFIFVFYLEHRIIQEYFIFKQFELMVMN